jgi:hypothetical protein
LVLFHVKIVNPLYFSTKEHLKNILKFYRSLFFNFYGKILKTSNYEWLGHMVIKLDRSHKENKTASSDETVQLPKPFLSIELCRTSFPKEIKTNKQKSFEKRKKKKNSFFSS